MSFKLKEKKTLYQLHVHVQIITSDILAQFKFIALCFTILIYFTSLTCIFKNSSNSWGFQFSWHQIFIPFTMLTIFIIPLILKLMLYQSYVSHWQFIYQMNASLI